MLVLPVSKYFHELLKNCCLTACAPLRELRGIVIVAVNFPGVFVVTILCAENGRTDGASEMFDMVLPV